MEFMTYLLECLNEEITGKDSVSEDAAVQLDHEKNSGWASVSTSKTKMKTKIKVENVIDDKSRMYSAKSNAATTITRLFYGTLRSVVCYPVSKETAKKVNSSTFQQFSNLNLNISAPMERTGPFSPQNFKRKNGAANSNASSGNKVTVQSSLSNEPTQQCLLPPLTLGRALEGYFQSTQLDEGAYKTIQFEHLPQVLVLQLDRFYYDYDRNVPNKIDRDIRYPMTLELPTNMLSAELIDRLQEDAAAEERKQHGVQSFGLNNDNNVVAGAVEVSYSLVGVVRHHGATATSGHYTALCRDNKLSASTASAGSSVSASLSSPASRNAPGSASKAAGTPTTATTTATTGSAGKGTTATGTVSTGGSKWGWEYDDAKVTAITAEDALQATQTAYILLYCRN